MNRTEYKVVPAPQKSQKARGVKAGADRFALTLETLINELAEDGWEYQRAETLPTQERKGLTSTTTVWHNVLVFRRKLKVPVASDLTGLRNEATAPASLGRTLPPLGPASRSASVAHTPAETIDQSVVDRRDAAASVDLRDADVETDAADDDKSAGVGKANRDLP